MPDTTHQEVNPHHKEAQKQKKRMEDSGLTMVIGIVLVLVVWLIRKYVINQKKEEN